MTAAGGGPTVLVQRLEFDGLTVEFTAEVQSQLRQEGPSYETARYAVDAEIAELQEAIHEVDDVIDRWTNHSDRVDYAIAVASGIVAGIVDSLWVGELSLVRGRGWGSEQVNKIVMSTARRYGYMGDDLSGAIRLLEDKFPMAGDSATYKFGGGTIHHLRDLTHHPSPVGLVASIVMQFTGNAFGIVDGGLQPVDVSLHEHIGSTVGEKLWWGTFNWLLHLISDVAGSSSNAGLGTGLPGPILSVVYGAGALISKAEDSGDHSKFFKVVEGLFRGDRSGTPIDLRTELGLASELGRQALPVLLNEALVRCLYFFRRAAVAIRTASPKSLGELVRVDLAPALPWGNRTITRMLTVAASTFTAVDLLDASVRAAIASSGAPEAFAGKFLLRVNFVGVARTTVAIGIDIHQGVKRSDSRNERIALMNQQLLLLNARTFYKIGDVWTAAGEANAALQITGEVVAVASHSLELSWAEMAESSVQVQKDLHKIRAERPSLLQQLQDDLEWGVD